MDLSSWFVEQVQANPLLVSAISLVCAMLLSAILASGGHNPYD
jgi:hypothetical protein